jgi:hypothetical protein
MDCLFAFLLKRGSHVRQGCLQTIRELAVLVKPPMYLNIPSRRPRGQDAWWVLQAEIRGNSTGRSLDEPSNWPGSGMT